MTSQGCDYLDETHPALRAEAKLHAEAVRLLLEEALSCSARCRLEFDRRRLLAALGPDDAARLLPTLPAEARVGPVDVHEEFLNDDRRCLLRRVLSFAAEKWPDPPLNYIDRVLFFSADGRVVLRANDNLEFILFALPDEARARLVERYQVEGIPEDVITQVDVDIDQGISRQV
jgi:hypothetical protein